MAPAAAASSHAAPKVTSASTSSSHAPAAYPADTYLRVFNAVPNGPAMAIYLNGTLSYSYVGYPGYSAYDPLFPGIWNVSVDPAGTSPQNVTKDQILYVNENLAAGVYYTVALVGTLKTISTVLLTDSNAAPTASDFNARFFNAGVNNTPASTITALDPITGATNFTLPSEPFGSVSAYTTGIANQSANVTDAFTYNSAVQVYYNNTAFTTNDYTIALVGYSNNTTAVGPALVFLLDGSYSLTPTTVHKVVAAITPTTTLNTYTVLPAIYLFSLSVTNASILTTNTQFWLNITDFTTSTVCQSINLAPFVYNVSATTVPYLSVPTIGTTAVATWGIELTSALVVNTTLKGCAHFAGDPAIISLAAAITDPTNGTSNWAVATEQTSFVYTPVTSLLHVTSTAAAPTVYTIYANYTAQYVGRVTLSVFNPVNGLVTFSANLIWSGTTPTTATWTQTVAGAYPYTLSVYTAYGVYNTTGVINILPSGQTFYNSTTWTNATLISGLSSSAAGTILLIVGLLIGMIVAMVVGRMVWGGPKTVPPAQPWAQQPAAAAANTCSVCGKSFGTPEELAAHSKSEHGMQ